MTEAEQKQQQEIEAASQQMALRQANNAMVMQYLQELRVWVVRSTHLLSTIELSPDVREAIADELLFLAGMVAKPEALLERKRKE